MSNKQSVNALNDAVKELEAAHEAARLKAHLLSMDARRIFEDLEGKVQTVKSELHERGEKAVETSAVAARDLAHVIRKFVEKNL